MSFSQETVTLSRDVVGILIPAGTKVELPEGAEAVVTQALGGSFTVQVQGHLFRIDGKDADVLGKTPEQAPVLSADASEAEVTEAVRAQLKTVYDPEIPINVVDLGLIYDCRLKPAGGADGGWKLQVAMTLTAPGCGMGDILVADVKAKALAVPTVRDAAVELVFDPPWTQDMMSEEAKLQAGFI